MLYPLGIAVITFPKYVNGQLCTTLSGNLIVIYCDTLCEIILKKVLY